MKKLLLIFLLICIAPVALSEAAPFTIDARNVYSGMARPYAQGYAPAISGNTATLVLPLISESADGDITAEFVVGDVSTSPVKISNKFTKTVKRETFTFSGEKVSAYRVEFKLALYASRLSGEYPCRINISGKDASGNAISGTFPVTLRISDGQERAEAPDVSIEAFSVDGPLYVGGSGTLLMRVANQSAAREARDVTITMADATGDILPKDSDTAFVGTLAPFESAPVEIPVNALSKGAAEPHAVTLTLTYRYANGQTATKSEKYTVDLQQEVRLNHTEAALPTRVTQGENVQFNLTLMNMGKGVLNNALLTFDIPHMAAGGSVLAGTIEPGKSTAATANLRVDGDFEGDTAGTLLISWEDGYGMTYEKTLPLSTTVLKKADPPAAAGTPAKDAKNESLSIRETLAWSAAALFLLLLGIKTLLSGRKIRKLEEKQL